MTDKADKQAAHARLLELVKPGDDVRTILRHVTKSGMSRSVSVVIQGEDYTWLVARVLGEKLDQKHDGIKVPGCGFDAGFSLVYDMGQVLYPNGFECPGNRCSSNDHSNGDRNYEPHTHGSGGYAFTQRWL